MVPNIVFFTGAGISAESGIPTFQEQPGIRDKLSRGFANCYPEEYRKVMRVMVDACENAEPNDAHRAIAELGCLVITMNVDRLHTKAGSKNVMEIHGVLPTREELEDEHFPYEYRDIVLYGDMAPKYYDAQDLVDSLDRDSIFIIVGTSFYTGISERLRNIARYRGAYVCCINSDAAERVPELCDFLKNVDVKDIKSSDLDGWKDF
jgi:NAD-dependent deacetylase